MKTSSLFKVKQYHLHLLLSLTLLLIFPGILLAQCPPADFADAYSILCNNISYSSATNLFGVDLQSNLWFTMAVGSIN